MVVGMHRSGTSCTAGVLAQLGYAAPENMIGANKSNPKGHWEAEPVARLNDRILTFAGSEWRSWGALNRNWINTPYFDRFVNEGRSVLSDVFSDAPMIVLKDPRLCRLATVWFEILKSSGFETTVFMPIRHPGEVSASLGARNAIDAAQGQYLWLRYMLDAEIGTRGRPRFLFRYSNLVKDWRETLRQAEVAAGAIFPRLNDVTAASVDAFVDQTLYRNRSANLNELQALHPLVQELYEILAGWADRGECAEDYGRIDEIDEVFSEYAKQVRPLFQTFDNVQRRLKAMQDTLAQQNASLAEMRTQAEAGAEADTVASPGVVEAISAQLSEIDGLQSTLKQMTKELIDDGGGLRANLANVLSRVQTENLTHGAGAKAAKQEAEDRISALTGELALMREASETSAEQINELRETIESLRQQDAQARADAAKAYETVAELQSRVSTLMSELEQKRTETDHVYSERDAIATQAEALAMGVEEARRRENLLKNELQRSNDELISSFDEIVSLANLLRNAEQSTVALQSELAAEQEARQALEKKFQVQQNREAAQQKQIAELQDELAAAASRHRALNDKKKSADTKLLALRERHATLQARVAEMQDEMESRVSELRDELANASANHQALRGKKAAADAKLLALREDYAALQSRAEELKAQKLRSNSKLKALRGRHGSVLDKQIALDQAHKAAKHQLDRRNRQAELTSRIFELMASQQLAFPPPKKRVGMLGKLRDGRHRRWERFCHSLAEQGIFNAGTYLALHPDVAEIGVDPLVHYLTRGHLENREISQGAVDEAVANAELVEHVRKSQ